MSKICLFHCNFRLNSLKSLHIMARISPLLLLNNILFLHILKYAISRHPALFVIVSTAHRKSGCWGAMTPELFKLRLCLSNMIYIFVIFLQINCNGDSPGRRRVTGRTPSRYRRSRTPPTPALGRSSPKTACLRRGIHCPGYGSRCTLQQSMDVVFVTMSTAVNTSHISYVHNNM